MNKKSLNKRNKVSTSSEDRYMKAIRTDAARSVSVYLVFIGIFLSTATIIAIGCKQHIFVQYAGGALLVLSAAINILWRFQLGRLSRKKRFFSDGRFIEDKYAIVANLLLIAGTLMATFYAQWCFLIIRLWS